MKRHQNMWRNVVTLASVVADKFDESGREEVAAAIEAMDNEQRTFRPQTIRERAMLLSEYEQFAKELVDKKEILVKADHLARIMDRMITARWAKWHVTVARMQPDADSLICAEAGMPLCTCAGNPAWV